MEFVNCYVGSIVSFDTPEKSDILGVIIRVEEINGEVIVDVLAEDNTINILKPCDLGTFGADIGECLSEWIKSGCKYKRITPADVESANKQLKLKLISGSGGDRETCGCPLNILCPREELDYIDWADKVYGWEYVNGFLKGYDSGKGPEKGLDERINQGREDGLVCRKHFLEI